MGLAVTSHSREALGTLDVTDFEISDGTFSLPGVPVDVGATGRPVWVQEVAEGVYSLEAGGADIGVSLERFRRGLLLVAHE